MEGTRLLAGAGVTFFGAGWGWVALIAAAAGVAPSEAPQLVQNFLPALFSCPHAWQRRVSGLGGWTTLAPQLVQNFLPGATLAPHEWQVTISWQL